MSERDDKGRFPSSYCGNPAGRPKGSRNKLGEAFVAALCEDFEVHGVAAIVRVRETDPVAYVKVCAGLLPRQLRITDDERDLTDDELDRRIRQLAGILGVEVVTAKGPGGSTDDEEADGGAPDALH